MATLRFCFLTTFYPPTTSAGTGSVSSDWRAPWCHAATRSPSCTTLTHSTSCGAAPCPRWPGGGSDGLRVVRLRTRFPRLSALLTHQLGRPVIHARALRTLDTQEHFDVVVFHNVSLVGGPGILSFAVTRCASTWRTSTGWYASRTCSGDTTANLRRTRVRALRLPVPTTTSALAPNRLARAAVASCRPFRRAEPVQPRQAPRVRVPVRHGGRALLRVRARRAASHIDPAPRSPVLSVRSRLERSRDSTM